MGKGQGEPLCKVHYKGKEDDFIIFVESADAVRSWRNDKSIPLAQTVDGFKIFVNHKQGAQGVLDTASKGTLDSEFGTHKDDDVMAQIMEHGDIQESESQGKAGPDRNKTGRS